MSLMSVALVSRNMMPSALTLDPTVNFFFAKTPVFPQPDTGQALDAALARSPIDPGDRHMQHVGDLLDRQKPVVVSLPCGHVLAVLKCSGVREIVSIMYGGPVQPDSLFCRRRGMSSHRRCVLAHVELGCSDLHAVTPSLCERFPPIRGYYRRWCVGLTRL